MEMNKLNDKTVPELKDVAKAMGLTNLSKLNRGSLIDVITKATVGDAPIVSAHVEEVQATVEPVVEKKKVYALSDIVTVISLIKNGKLSFKDTEGIVQRWAYYGAEVDLTFKDIRLMNAQHHRFFKDCWIKIPDDVAKQLKIKNYLENSKIKPDNIDNAFLLKPDDFYDALLGSTDGVQQLVVDTAIEKLRNEELDSMRILRIIKKITGKDIEELAKFMDFSDGASK